MFKKFSAILTAFLLMFSLLQIKEVSNALALDNDFDPILHKVTESIENFEERVDISEFKISLDEIENLLLYIEYYASEYFYVNYKYSYIDNTVQHLIFEYIYSKEEILNKRMIFNNKTEDILSIIPKNISTVDKLLFLHDYIALNNRYDTRVYNNIDTSKEKEIRNAYGCLVNEKSVCEGISKAFIYLCKRLGIEAFLVKSDRMKHEWVIVNVNGNFYHIDITYDSLVYMVNNKAYIQPFGSITHDYFLKTNSEMKKLGYVDWQTTDKINNTDKPYNDPYWENTFSQFVFLDNYCYYIKNNSFIKRNISTGKQEEIVTFENEIWTASNKNNYILQNSFAKTFTDYKNKLVYFCLSDKIYAYNVENNYYSEVYTFNNSGFIYAAYSRNGTLYYSVFDYLKNNVQNFSNYELTKISIPTANYAIGDINANGKTEVSDVLSLKRYLYKDKNCFANLDFADLNKDKYIDIKDVLLLGKIIAGVN